MSRDLVQPRLLRPDQVAVDYAAVFKRAEPFAYSHADDDATSTFTCAGGCAYRITFGLTPRRRPGDRLRSGA